MEEDDDYLAIKILVVGESSVGKTSLVKRYTKGEFSEHYKATIGVDFSLRKVKWRHNLELHLHFWDLIGQERIDTLTKSYYRNAMGAICVYDLTRDTTRNKTLDWRDLLADNCISQDGAKLDIPIILVGNKVDLLETEALNNPEVKLPAIEEINSLAVKLGFIGGIITSAKHNIGVDDAVKILIAEILRRSEANKALQNDETREEETVTIGNDSNITPSHCSKC